MSTATVTMTFAFPTNIFADLVTYWTLQGSTIGTLAAPVSATDESCTIGQSFNIQPGHTICIDGEPIPVASVSGQTVNFGARGQYATKTPATHAQGAQVMLLQYPDWFGCFSVAANGWAANAINMVMSRGMSITLPPATGSISVTIS